MSEEIEQLKAELADAKNTIEEYKEAFDGLMEQREQLMEKFHDALLFIEQLIEAKDKLLKQLKFEQRWNNLITGTYLIITLYQSYYIINHIK